MVQPFFYYHYMHKGCQSVSHVQVEADINDELANVAKRPLTCRALISHIEKEGCEKG